MVDMHSHILPGMDDGSKSVEMSIEMLKKSKEQGIDIVVATPHCNLKREEDIYYFLKRRERSYKLLMEAINKENEELPEIRLGCEIHFSRDISNFEGIEKLCYENTNYMLIEMPYNYWNSVLFDYLYAITIKGYRPIMAHIERFFAHEREFSILRDMDLLYQVNAESILESKMSKPIAYCFKNNMIHFLGSDMHNNDKRPQKLLSAYRKVEKMYGIECADYIDVNARLILDNDNIGYYQFKKKSIFRRI